MFEYALAIFMIIAFIAISIYIGRAWYKSKKFPLYATLGTICCCLLSLSVMVAVNLKLQNDALSTGFAACCILLALISIIIQMVDAFKK